jgi:hypothetical protein
MLITAALHQSSEALAFGDMVRRETLRKDCSRLRVKSRDYPLQLDLSH